MKPFSSLFINYLSCHKKSICDTSFNENETPIGSSLTVKIRCSDLKNWILSFSQNIKFGHQQLFIWLLVPFQSFVVNELKADNAPDSSYIIAIWKTRNDSCFQNMPGMHRNRSNDRGVSLAQSNPRHPKASLSLHFSLRRGSGEKKRTRVTRDSMSPSSSRHGSSLFLLHPPAPFAAHSQRDATATSPHLLTIVHRWFAATP
jgi:hypothetical protein